MQGTKGKLLSTGYLQALAMGAEIIGKTEREEKMGALAVKGAEDREKQKLIVLQAPLDLLLAEILVNYY